MKIVNRMNVIAALRGSRSAEESFGDGSSGDSLELLSDIQPRRFQLAMQRERPAEVTGGNAKFSPNPLHRVAGSFNETCWRFTYRNPRLGSFRPVIFAVKSSLLVKPICHFPESLKRVAERPVL